MVHWRTNGTGWDGTGGVRRPFGVWERSIAVTRSALLDLVLDLKRSQQKPAGVEDTERASRCQDLYSEETLGLRRAGLAERCVLPHRVHHCMRSVFYVTILSLFTFPTFILACSGKPPSKKTSLFFHVLHV